VTGGIEYPHPYFAGGLSAKHTQMPIAKLTSDGHKPSLRVLVLIGQLPFAINWWRRRV